MARHKLSFVLFRSCRRTLCSLALASFIVFCRNIHVLQRSHVCTLERGIVSVISPRGCGTGKCLVPLVKLGWTQKQAAAARFRLYPSKEYSSSVIALGFCASRATRRYKILQGRQDRDCPRRGARVAAKTLRAQFFLFLYYSSRYKHRGFVRCVSWPGVMFRTMRVVRKRR